MKAYMTVMDGKFLARMFKPGILSPFREQLTVDHGVPERATIIGVRLSDYADLQILWLTEEPGTLPGAVDLWSFAEVRDVTLGTSVLGPTEVVPATEVGRATFCI